MIFLSLKIQRYWLFFKEDWVFSHQAAHFGWRHKKLVYLNCLTFENVSDFGLNALYRKLWLFTVNLFIVQILEYHSFALEIFLKPWNGIDCSHIHFSVPFKQYHPFAYIIISVRWTRNKKLFIHRKCFYDKTDNTKGKSTIRLNWFF